MSKHHERVNTLRQVLMDALAEYIKKRKPLIELADNLEEYQKATGKEALRKLKHTRENVKIAENLHGSIFKCDLASVITFELEKDEHFETLQAIYTLIDEEKWEDASNLLEQSRSKFHPDHPELSYIGGLIAALQR